MTGRDGRQHRTFGPYAEQLDMLDLLDVSVPPCCAVGLDGLVCVLPCTHEAGRHYFVTESARRTLRAVA